MEPVYRTRGYIPHLEDPSKVQLITWRTEDSLPKHLPSELEHELSLLPEGEKKRQKAVRAERILNKGLGQCELKDPQIGGIVRDALLFGNGTDYDLLAWVVMPNHVHVLAHLSPGNDLARQLQRWKSFTSHEINRALERTGPFWAREYFDRFIRNEEHLNRALEYIENNPVTAGLCSSPGEWLLSSATP